MPKRRVRRGDIWAASFAYLENPRISEQDLAAIQSKATAPYRSLQKALKPLDGDMLFICGDDFLRLFDEERRRCSPSAS